MGTQQGKVGENTERDSHLQGREHSTENKWAGTLSLDFLPSRTVKKKISIVAAAKCKVLCYKRVNGLRQEFTERSEKPGRGTEHIYFCASYKAEPKAGTMQCWIPWTHQLKTEEKQHLLGTHHMSGTTPDIVKIYFITVSLTYNKVHTC